MVTKNGVTQGKHNNNELKLQAKNTKEIVSSSKLKWLITETKKKIKSIFR